MRKTGQNCKRSYAEETAQRIKFNREHYRPFGELSAERLWRLARGRKRARSTALRPAENSP